MGSYLRIRDYYKQIQSDNLQQIIGSDDSIRVSSERAAQAELISYLVQKYDVNAEFIEIQPFSMATIYEVDDLVELDATAWSGTTPYVVNDLVSLAGKVYSSIQAGTNQNPVTAPTYWRFIGTQYTLFFVPPPFPFFDYNTMYSVGDQVFWKNKIYTCRIATAAIDQETLLQFAQYSNVPLLNIPPDDVNNGIQYWGTGVNFRESNLWPNASTADYAAWSSVTSYVSGNRVSFDSKIYQATASSTNVSPETNLAKWIPVTWEEGDNRSQQLVMFMIDIALYHIHSRIAPRNVPLARCDRYDSAIDWLKRASRGEITADIPLLKPKKGGRIRYGGNIKNINTY